MALTMYYRSNSFVKMWVANYLKYIFLANKKGALIFSDGSKNIEFSEMPYVGRTLEWEPQHLPAVLIDKATTNMVTQSISKDFIYEARSDDTEQYRYVGGDILIDLNILVRARTMPERENLADIVSLYLAHPDAKDYFMRHDIAIEKVPSVSGESSVPAPGGLDFPIYICSMSLGVRSQWVQKEAITDPRLNEIIATVEAEVNL